MPTLATKRTMARANEPAAKRIRTLERAVQQNKAELKFREGTASVTDGFADLSRFIPKGTDRDERVGDIVNIKKVEVRTLGNEGTHRYRMILYTPKDQNNNFKPLELGDNFVSFIDNEQYNVWSEDFDTSRVLAAAGTANFQLAGRIAITKKTFSIPMKTKWRKADAVPYHNPVVVQLVTQSGTALAIQPPVGFAEFQYKIWYYDA